MPARVSRRPAASLLFQPSEEFLASMLACYDVGRLISVSPFLIDGDECVLLEDRSNTSYKSVVHTDRGRYLLKRVPWYCDDVSYLGFQYDFSDYLRGVGFPAAKVETTRDRLSWFEFQKSRFVLFEYVPGCRYRESVTQSRSAAETLARLHRAAFVSRSAPREDLFERAASFIDMVKDSITPLVRGERDARFQEAIIFLDTEMFQPLRDRLERARNSCSESGWERLGRVGVHGDYSPSNLIFDQLGMVNAVVDFDNCDIDSPLHDLAEAILCFGVLNFKPDTTVFEDLHTASIGPLAFEFVRTYEQIAPLADCERECLPHIMVATLVELLCLGIVRGDFQLSEHSRMLSLLDGCEGFRPWRR
jgi:Ser/Thr protein kinase RdoA (MazF antagonist)